MARFLGEPESRPGGGPRPAGDGGAAPFWLAGGILPLAADTPSLVSWRCGSRELEELLPSWLAGGAGLLFEPDHVAADTPTLASWALSSLPGELEQEQDLDAPTGADAVQDPLGASPAIGRGGEDQVDASTAR